MKKVILLFVAIFASSFIYAQCHQLNKSTEKVTGDYNSTIVEQLGNENCNYSWVIGDQNNTNVFQTFACNEPYGKNESVIKVVGNCNTTDIDQIGNENKVGVCCSSPGWEHNWNCQSWGTYFARNDKYGLMVNGSNNYTKIYQEGNQNAAEVNINGPCSGCPSCITGGNYNNTQIHQYGVCNSAEETIYGSHNYTYTLQH